MLNKKIKKELDAQLHRELNSAYIYYGMASYCASITMNGASVWMLAQAKEELEHAGKIFKYLCDREEAPKLAALPEPKSNYKSVLDVFESALKHECYISESFEKIASLAQEEGDHTTYHFTKWFLEEQIEEVQQCADIVHKLKLVGDHGAALLQVDIHLGHRGQ